MSVRTRARSLTVVAILAAGGVGLIGSTQTWAVARLVDSDVPVSGASAVPVLQPLMLTALALGLVLTLVGRVLRYVLGALAIVVAAVLVLLTWPLLATPPASAVAPTVTERTGLAGAEAVRGVVVEIAATPWPLVSLVAAVVIGLAGVAVLGTAHAWSRGGRRYSAAASHPAASGAAGAESGPADAAPLDAVDSWDDLSRGDDPTR
ncbi:Trp biosynthesis-associated membrane protein [Microbacterium sp. NPDC096154]|uniref:Trp biosynthesis-associated membrane protein n=1 Tax=Microbacterium sp. NPDC096154 TaxID=3155549 RepID=UPI003322F7A5